MVVSYSTGEILGVAETVEKNAARFYAKAAEKADDAEVKELLLKLNKMEETHVQVFADMRKELTDKDLQVETSDPGNEMLFYLQGTAEIHGWEGKRDPNTLLTGQESMAEILNIAVNAEKEAVFLYTSFRDFVPEDRGRDKVERMIREEMKHVAILTQQLRALQG